MDFSGRFYAFLASRRGVAVTVLVLIVLMVASANIVAARFLTSRLDLTAEHLYTLSQGTRNTLAKIDERAAVNTKASAAVTTKAMT